MRHYNTIRYAKAKNNMTTSLSKSTIPTYDPNDTYLSPRQVPRVKFEGRENYEKNRGSLNIGDWSIQSKDWQSPRPPPKVKYEEAQKTYIQHREGSMKDILGGYCDPPIQRKGPRIKNEARDNFIKNKGTFNYILNDYGKGIDNSQINPRVFYEGKSNNIKGHGSMGNLLGNYGKHPLSARPISRIKFEGNQNLENGRGEGVNKTLHMIPPSSRPSSSQFFNNNLW